MNRSRIRRKPRADFAEGLIKQFLSEQETEAASHEAVCSSRCWRCWYFDGRISGLKSALVALRKDDPESKEGAA